METGSQPPFDRGPQSPAQPTGPQSPMPPQGAPGSPGLPPPTNVPPGGWNQPMPQSGPGMWRFASWGSRALATIIDWLVILVPAIAIYAVLIAVGFSSDSDGGIAAVVIGALVGVLALTITVLLYAPLLMKRPGERNGQTLGKQMLNIRVVRADGRPMDFGTGALREVVLKYLAVGLASTFIPFLPWLLDILWPLWDDQSRALHDLAASTRVVRA